MRTRDGPATLHLRRSGTAVEAVGYGPGMARALESVPGLIGIDAAAPILMDAFARLERRTPLRAAPPGILEATTATLPQPLRRLAAEAGCADVRVVSSSPIEMMVAIRIAIGIVSSVLYGIWSR